MSITVTQSAMSQIQKEINKQPDAIGVRLHLQTAGCSGYMYRLNVIHQIIDPDDLCFDHGIKLYVAKQDYPILQGTEIDFVRDGLNSVFKYKNPNETGSCGCGESFTINEEFKNA